MGVHNAEQQPDTAWLKHLAPVVLILSILVVAMLAALLGALYYNKQKIDTSDQAAAELVSSIDTLSTDVAKTIQETSSSIDDLSDSTIGGELARIASALETVSRSNQGGNSADNHGRDAIAGGGNAPAGAPIQQVVALLPQAPIVSATGTDQSRGPGSENPTSSAAGAATAAFETKILARWVQLVPSPHEFDPKLDHPAQALVRAVVEGTEAPCPVLHLNGPDGPPLPMTPRSNPEPKAFPVTVCQALLPRSKVSKAISHLSPQKGPRIYRSRG